MPIFSRRYLFTYDEVVKYLGFAEKGLDSYGLSGINPKYLTTKEFVECIQEISSFRNRHSLFSGLHGEFYKTIGRCTLKKDIHISWN
ncbi:MAG TPA: hypothetical protein VMW42_05960 [Desulfatiglandales bacterium]|nr:hypothetical protein [Desulfatiglandales bacterium]